MNNFIKRTLDKWILAERSASKLALSFCLGNFIALSPTIPLQTPLVMLLSRLLSLNTTIAVTALYVINNPFTMVPFYALDYVFGNWLLKLASVNVARYNPVWMDRFSHFIARFIDIKKYLGIDVLSFWPLLVGGVVLPLVVSIVLYPVVKWLFSRLLARRALQERKETL